MISALDSKVMDANAVALGTDIETLMGNAGKAIADYLTEAYPGKSVAFCCGHGNNGGDGFAAASIMKNACTKVFCITEKKNIQSPTVRKFMDRCPKVQPFSKCKFDFEILVDCGLGTGISGELRPDYAEYVKKVSAFKGCVVAVDVPTGFGTKSSIKPDVTITMHDKKERMTEKNCGKIIVADIQMPERAYLETGPGDLLRYPVPRGDSHKGSNGRLLVIGGGPYFGAPAMSSMAALRIGADLVTVAAPESVFHEIASISPVLMIEKLPGEHLCTEHLPKLLELAQSNDAVLIGPGLGKDPSTVDAVRRFVSECGKPMVIDADGLNALGKNFKIPNKETVLTPHAKEYERLGGTDRAPGSVVKFASSWKCTVLLKGQTDIISNGKTYKSNNTGCAAMTGAGTGDVLAGIVAGLLSKGLCAYESAYLGAYISGNAGEMAFYDLSYGLIATDIIDRIPKVLHDGLKGRKS